MANESISVYRNKIESIAMEYIESLPDQSMIQKSMVFQGLLDNIYIRVFKPDRRTREYKENKYNTLQTSILDYSDINILYDLWVIYKALCSKCNIVPSVHGYCSMIGLSFTVANDWKNGKIRDNEYTEQGKKITSKHTAFIKYITAETEGFTRAKVANENSIGNMFILKAAYGWREAAPISSEELLTARQSQSAEQIAERHASAILPEKADIIAELEE